MNIVNILSILTLFILKMAIKIKAKLLRLFLRLKDEHYSLTLFAAEDEGRTEQPTDKKKRRAREEEGRVINSVEINQTLVLFSTISIIAILVGYFANILKTFMIKTFSMVSTADTSMSFLNLRSMFLDIVILMGETAGITLFVALIVGVGINLMQTKFLFSTKKIKPNFKRIAPTWKNFKERAFFSPQNMMNLVKIIFKMLVIAVITYTTIKGRYHQILAMPNMGIDNALQTFFFMVLEMIFKTLAFMVLVSVVDYFFQKKQYIDSLKMTKFEIKEEFKEMEGDPLVKNRLQEMARRIIRQTMLKAIPEADVVITNPTHFAVALKYDATSMHAPTVVAKGADHLAQKIKEIARDAGVEIIENKPLARELYFNVDIGKTIPERLFFVVSRILSAIYTMKRGRRNLKNAI